MLSTLARASLRGERAQQRQQPRLSAAAPRQAAGRVRRGPAPCSASSGPTGGPSDGQDEPSTSGDGEELAAILSAEITAREKLILAVENEKDRLREVVEKASDASAFLCSSYRECWTCELKGPVRVRVSR